MRRLNDKPVAAGKYVLYWMQQSQRTEWNHALEFAVERANVLDLPLLVGFGLTAKYPDANLRHYVFMLEGLAETAVSLRRRRIKFALQVGDPAEVALRLGHGAAEIVCDRGYLRVQKHWRARVVEKARCRVTQVESDVIVPVDVASNKPEFAARTIRPKLLRQHEQFLDKPKKSRLKKDATRLRVRSVALEEIPQLHRKLRLDRSVKPVTKLFQGGTKQAIRRFREFLRNGLPDYSEHRNQPQTNDVSHMSKYLHFGQVSPVWLLCEARKATKAGRANIYTFVEELLVRRELAMNWCEFTPNYDKYAALPRWARETLSAHRHDRRSPVYSRQELEAAKTNDPYWNASMREMLQSGYMHNYMRMYWGKKILEWSRTPEDAFATALYLNNKYFLDGRDPNSYAGVAWVFGQHDRPWGERPIFGKVRYMNAAGLERKCDIHAYVEKIASLEKSEFLREYD